MGNIDYNTIQKDLKKTIPNYQIMNQELKTSKFTVSQYIESCSKSFNDCDFEKYGLEFND